MRHAGMVKDLSMVETAKRNIELKARYPNLQMARDVCREIMAQFQGILEQEDIYFVVLRGRLKLRTIDGKRCELIAYDRPNEAEGRVCDYHIVEIPNRDHTAAALQSVLGIRGIVRKQRELYLWHNVRIHLDAVESLGNFLEFEAVVSENADEEICRLRLHELAARMHIVPEHHIAGSYIDFLQLPLDNR
jgi:predicted adenylyl cyclase CyaB